MLCHAYSRWNKWNVKILIGPVMGHFFNCGDTSNGPIWALTLDVAIGELVSHN